MSLVHRPDDPTDEPSPVRPYIVARVPAREPEVAWLRPYLLTSGRAGPLGDEVEIEAQVMTTCRRPHQRPQHNLEIVERVIRGLQAIA